MSISIASRVASLETAVRDRARSDTVDGLPRDTYRAVLHNNIRNDTGIDLLRTIAMLEDTADKGPRGQLSGDGLTKADLPRLRAECEANWRAWYVAEFGSDGADALCPRGSAFMKLRDS